MVRRNLFTPPPPPADAPDADAKPRFPNTGAMGGVRATLKDMSANAVREIAPDMIEEDGPRDRLAFTDEDVAALAESIRAHGQQVPIMVRPLPDKPGRYRIVYGRRRLHALRLLAQPAKALVRSLSDAEAILAQGQENAQRLDPSFIEKALFAAGLADGGYDNAVILDALAVDKPMLSRMLKVARTIPETVIRQIGPAHGIGRRRWEDLADRTREEGLDLAALSGGIEGLDRLSSDDRFAAVAGAALRKPQTGVTPPALPLTLPDGTVFAELRTGARSVTIKLHRTGGDGFAEWLQENAQSELRRLHAAWRAADNDKA